MKLLQCGRITLIGVSCSIVWSAFMPATSQAQANLPLPIAPAKSAKHYRSFMPDVPDPTRVANAQQVETFKMDGLLGNRAHIPEMIVALKENTDISQQYAAWFALSRLGAAEAVPEMDLKLKRVYYSPDTELGEFARACRARLVAETEATPHAMATRFFQEIGETPDQLNSTLEKYNRAQAAHPGSPPSYPWKEMRARAMLADMIYHGPAAELLADPTVQKVDIHQDSAAIMKVELALLTLDQQRERLVNMLENSDDFGYGLYCGQLLIDLGRPEAIDLLTSKLKDLKKNHANHSNITGANLKRVLYAAGDTSQNPNVLDKYEVRQLRRDF